MMKRIGWQMLVLLAMLLVPMTGLQTQAAVVEGGTSLANQWDIAQQTVVLPGLTSGNWMLDVSQITSTHPDLHIGRVEVFENDLMVAQSARFKVGSLPVNQQLVFAKTKDHSRISVVLMVFGGQGQARWGSVSVTPTQQLPLPSMFDTWLAHKTCDVTSTLNAIPQTDAFDPAPSPIEAGELRLQQSTLHAIGLQWDMKGDFNRNATVTVTYRKTGESQWQDAQPLLRTLFDGAGTSRIGWHVVCPNRFSGSVLNLDPATSYQIRLTLHDPDGGDQQQIIEAQTKQPLTDVANAAVLHVYPQTYQGARLTPSFDTIHQAYDAVEPGQTILLHSGVHQFGDMQARQQRYGDQRIAYIHPPLHDQASQLYTDFSAVNRQLNRVIHLNKQATISMPITITGAADGSTILDGGAVGIMMDLTGAASHRISHLTFRNLETAIYANDAQQIEITNCRFVDLRYGINAGPHDDDHLNKQSDNSPSRITGWTVSNNSFIGNWPDGQWQNGWSVDKKIYGYLPLRLNTAIQLGGQGHDVAHNLVRGFWDGISVYPIVMPPSDPTMCNGSIDLYNNRIDQCPDDGIEMDYGVANIRVIRNYITNTHMGISMQPVFGGPGYVLRNVIYNTRIFALKIARNPSGLRIYHNTFAVANAARMETGWANTLMANNLFLGSPYTPSGPLWTGNPTPLLSKLDYNGYSQTACNKWFWVIPAMDRPYHAAGQIVFDTFADFQNITGMETHGISNLSMNTLVNVPAPTTRHWDEQPGLNFGLAYDSPAVDRGMVLPNINDQVTGDAPDLGALEQGVDLPVYGPVLEETSHE
ncbi:MAG: hypothetical protein ACF8OB_03440 [Phycisphaeraceae bacterium JB051]